MRYLRSGKNGEYPSEPIICSTEPDFSTLDTSSALSWVTPNLIQNAFYRFRGSTLPNVLEVNFENRDTSWKVVDSHRTAYTRLGSGMMTLKPTGIHKWGRVPETNTYIRKLYFDLHKQGEVYQLLGKKEVGIKTIFKKRSSIQPFRFVNQS